MYPVNRVHLHSPLWHVLDKSKQIAAISGCQRTCKQLRGPHCAAFSLAEVVSCDGCVVARVADPHFLAARSMHGAPVNPCPPACSLPCPDLCVFPGGARLLEAMLETRILQVLYIFGRCPS
jgi:hypothetical protein